MQLSRTTIDSKRNGKVKIVFKKVKITSKKVRITFKKVKIITKKKPKRKSPALFLIRFSQIQKQDNKRSLKMQSMRI